MGDFSNSGRNAELVPKLFYLHSSPALTKPHNCFWRGKAHAEDNVIESGITQM